MLCAVCLSMFRRSDSRGRHHACWTHVVRAAKNGCRICALITEPHYIGTPSVIGQLFYHIEEKVPGRLALLSFGYQELASESKEFPPCRSLDLIFHVTRPPPINPHHKSFRLAAHDLTHTPWCVRQNSFDRDIPVSTAHPKVLEQALRWYKTCLSDHKKCVSLHETRHAGWRPKRLLDLSNLPKVRILITRSNEDAVTEPYATLSHCWGRDPHFLKLERNTERYLTRGFSKRVLPRSFQDAIEISARLRIRYLWIDSLCIYQSGPGSKGDWHEQVSEMQSIYSNSVLNISLDRAENPHQGAFTQRQPGHIQPLYFLWNRSGEREEVWKFFDEGTQELQSSPLQKRAWVFQERIFSPRVLHFCSEQIMWECKEEHILTEQNPYKDVHPLHRPFPFSIPAPSAKHLTRSKLKAERQYALQVLPHIIADYTSRDLTYPTQDKLAAFSGVAQRFGVLFDDEYVAGFFLQQLPAALTWGLASETPEKLTKRYDVPYRAPSWSWAVTNERVHIGQHLYSKITDLAEVVGAEVEPVDENNKYGPLKSARLTLSAVLIPCTREELSEGRKIEWVGSHAFPLHGQLNGDFDGKKTLAGAVAIAVDYEGAKECDSFFVPIEVDKQWTTGLVLKSSDNEATFERTGIVSCKNNTVDECFAVSELFKHNKHWYQHITLI